MVTKPVDIIDNININIMYNIDYSDILFCMSLLSCVSYTCSLFYSSYRYIDQLVNMIVQGITYIYLTKIFRSSSNDLGYYVDLYGGYHNLDS